jgi:hypothetical protein
LQVYVAVELYVVPVWLTEPVYPRPGGKPQSTGVQVGVVPLHVPLAWQVRAAVLESVYPGSHLYVAVEPKVVPVVVTTPFDGPGAVGQSAGLQVGAVPLQVPSAWQVRGEVPASP